MALSPHLTTDIIERYRDRTLEPEEILALDDHVVGCESCRARLKDVEKEQEVFSFLGADLRADEEPTCLSYEQLASFVDNTMDEVDREIAESHLSICPQCDQEMQDLRAFKGLMSTYPAQAHVPTAVPSRRNRQRSFWRRPTVYMPLGAAGAMAVALWAVLNSMHPLQMEVASLKRQVLEERQKANTLNRQIATLPVMKSREEQLRQASERARQENLKLTRENVRLQARIRQPSTIPPPRIISPERGGSPRRGNGIVEPSMYTNLNRSPLNDGGQKSVLDPSGRLARVEVYPPDVQAAWKTGKLVIPSQDISGRGGILMGDPEDGTTFHVRTPQGIVIESDRPTLSWTPMDVATGYQVYLFDEKSSDEKNVSDPITETQWTVPQALKRGHLYRWEVVALKDGEEVDKAPRPPSPDARFKVLDEAKAVELAHARRAFGNSRLTMGVLYAKYGLLEDAERELVGLVKQNPKSDIAQKLLRQIRGIAHKNDR